AKGNLEIKDGKLKIKVDPTTLKGDNIAILNALNGATQSAEADFTSVDNNWGPRLGVVLRFQDQSNYYLLYRVSGGTTALRISKFANGVETVLPAKAVPQIAVNTPFHLKGTVASDGTLAVAIGAACGSSCPTNWTPTATQSIVNSTFSGGRL